MYSDTNFHLNHSYPLRDKLKNRTYRYYTSARWSTWMNHIRNSRLYRF